MNRVTYTRSSLEMGTCSLSHMNTYLHIPRLLLTLQCSHIIYIRHTEPPTQMVSKSGASNRCLGGLKYQVPPEIFKGLNQSTGNSWRARALHMLKIKPGGGWSWKFLSLWPFASYLISELLFFWCSHSNWFNRLGPATTGQSGETLQQAEGWRGQRGSTGEFPQMSLPDH